MDVLDLRRQDLTRCAGNIVALISGGLDKGLARKSIRCSQRKMIRAILRQSVWIGPRYSSKGRNQCQIVVRNPFDDPADGRLEPGAIDGAVL